jgi:hypothetical protein
MSLATIRAGLATAIETVDVNVYSFLPGSLVYPAVVVGWPETWTLGTSESNTDDYVVPVRVGVSLAHPESADVTLMELLDSVKAAIEADSSLGGACDDLSADSVTNIGQNGEGDVAVLVATINVTVYA